MLSRTALILLLAVSAAPALLPLPVRAQTESIAAVVNGSVITNSDVDARCRLFALSTGISLSPDVLARLRPQVTRQLVDERLRLQEITRRKIVVDDQEIAAAIKEIEQRNNMQPGMLLQRLQAAGVGTSTLIDELRAQIGWMRVLREELGDRAHITDTEIDSQMRIQKAQQGQPQFNVSEIFIAIDNPANSADAQRFADTVISQLRSGAPFAVVAAQFSQDQAALEGGSLGWVTTNQLDPAVARIVTQMPAGAISDPIPVAGGLSIVMLQGKRQAGNDMATFLSMRQVFLPFASPLNPQAPTDQQRQMLEKARQISLSAKTCDDMDAASKANNSPRPANPGDLRLDDINPPQLRNLLASQPVGKATQPLVAGDGVAVVMVCSRDQRNAAQLSKQQVADELLNQRVDLESRELQRDLRRSAMIQMRNSST
jgi:peptidyl-prolyl cis-trans isomerase SurA